MQSRSSRASHENGKVERNNGLFKRVLEKLAKKNCADSAHILVSETFLITNMLHGSTVLSSYQMVRGYSSSIIGLPAKIVPAKLFEAHIQLTAHRALMKALSSRVPRLLTQDELQAGTKIWVYYNTSKQNKRPKWILATIPKAEKHRVHCRWSEKGPPLTVAYEHVCLAPKSDLSKELMCCSLGEELTSEEPPQGHHTASKQSDYQSLKMDTPAELKDIFCEAENFTDDECEPLCPTVVPKSSFLATEYIGDASGDIGSELTATKPPHGVRILSDKQKVLTGMKNAIGSDQASCEKLAFAPAWVIAKAVDEEITSNWDGAYMEVNEKMYLGTPT